MACPDPETLARFADGLASETGAGELRGHVDGCATCQEVLVALAKAGRTPSAAASAAIPSGTLLGRYEVQGRLGGGGMGVVVAAWDKQLERKVALKLVRPELLGDARGEQTRARMVREAQLMAQVNHPNVVTVYDVGPIDDGIFISMELVEGQTLRAWLEGNARPWREVVERFFAAGRGLTAAHSAGLVHRDFKPDNVLLDAAGGVHVTDFGLAWSAQSQGGPAPESLPVSPVTPAGSGLSRQSAVLGTPAYMAPEQLKGQPVDARADQFSFCVALWEAVQGERPFEARRVGELLAAIDKGPRAPKREVPDWLEAVLRRGLAAAPEQRFASMAELLQGLERGLMPRRRPMFALLGGAAVLGLGFALIPRLLGSSCEDGAASVERVWNAAVKREIERRFLVAQSPHAKENWKLVADTLDGWANTWRGAWVSACQTRATADARARSTLCLEARLADFEVVVDVFKTADEPVIAAAPLAFSRLYGPEPCLHGETLTTVPLPVGPAARMQVAKSRLLAAQSDAARLSGRHASAMAMAKEAVELAKGSGYRPAEADALLALAEEQRARADFTRAAATLNDALLAAESGRHFEAIARIAVQQVFSLGTHSMKPDEAEAWLTRARGALEQMPRPELEAEVALATAFLRTSQGSPEAALEPATQAVESFRRLGKTVREQDALGVLAQAQALSGHAEEAVRLSSLMAEGRAALLGPTHPQTVRARLDIGQFLADAGQLERAVAELLAALESAKTAGLPVVSTLVANHALAKTLSALGRHHDALIGHRSVLALVQQTLGKKHRYVAAAEDAAATGLRDAGNLEAAEVEHKAALQIWAVADGATPEQVAGSHAQYAWTLAELGRADDALVQAQAALALEPGSKRTFAWAAAVATAHAAAATAKLELGQLESAGDDASAGVAAAETLRGPEVAVARARALRALGDVLHAAKGSPVEPWKLALAALRGVDPLLAPGQQAQLLCRLAIGANDCSQARECDRAVRELEVSTAPWIKGELGPEAVQKKLCPH